MDSRRLDLELLTELVRLNKDDIPASQSIDSALETPTFSRMERMERELKSRCQEKQFLMVATQILLNQ